MITDERLARAALCYVQRPGDPRLHRAIDEEGAVALWRQLSGDLGARPYLAEVDPQVDLARFAEIGGRLVCPGDDEWPDSLGVLRTCGGGPLEAREPFALWVRGAGNLAALCESSVSIVGARASSDYGNYVAGELAGDLAGRGWCIVSGGAYGIDAAAHRGALVVGGTTIAVLAGGADVAYPRAHDALFSRIAQTGCVISEEPPGQSARRERFLSRNRLIAALGKATVLVEAGTRSGALNTARHAQRMLRDLLAVPGPVTSAMSRGCHDQLREGYARLVTCAADVIEEIGPIQDRQPAFGLATARDGLTRAARVVLDGFPADSSVSPADLSFATGVPIAQVVEELESLLAADMIELTGSGFRLTRRARDDRPGGVVV